MEIIRHDMCKHFARVTEYNGVLYFTGHIAAGKQPTMTEQMVALTHRLDELLEQFGSDKNHILYAKINIHDWSMFDEFNAVWDAWFDPGCMPARTTAQSVLTDGYLVEITLTAAKISNNWQLVQGI